MTVVNELFTVNGAVIYNKGRPTDKNMKVVGPSTLVVAELV